MIWGIVLTFGYTVKNSCFFDGVMMSLNGLSSWDLIIHLHNSGDLVNICKIRGCIYKYIHIIYIYLYIHRYVCSQRYVCLCMCVFSCTRIYIYTHMIKRGREGERERERETD